MSIVDLNNECLQSDTKQPELFVIFLYGSLYLFIYSFNNVLFIMERWLYLCFSHIIKNLDAKLDYQILISNSVHNFFYICISIYTNFREEVHGMRELIGLSSSVTLSHKMQAHQTTMTARNFPIMKLFPPSIQR